MKHINKITLLTAKGLEVCHWIAQLTMIAALICTLVKGEWISRLLTTGIAQPGFSLTTYGFEMMITDPAGGINMTALIFYLVGSVMILSLMAMICRNVYLIVKKAEQTTPFQKDTLRMIREIGIFIASVPTVGFIISIIARIVIGVDGTEMSVNLSGFVIAILFFCLTQFFARGVQLETDMDGLL